MRRARPSITRRLIPFWLSLWLIASLGGPAAAWQHLDGTFCATCTSAAPVGDDDCAQESRPELSAATPDDCHKCCAPTPRPSPDKLIVHSVQAAILPTPHSYHAPHRREALLRFAFTARRLDALPRPPPRGRAPPIWFSISP